MIARLAPEKTAKAAPTHRTVLLIIAFVAGMGLPGCVGGRQFFGRHQMDPLAGAPRLQNANNPRLVEVVTHLNKNTDLVQSWRCDNVSIHASKWSLGGKLAVEKGRRIRLTVNSPMGTEVDLGSNDERFWIWSRRMDPAFVTCKHENLESARQNLGIPFEPDWLMQALGVAPLPTTGVKIEAAPNQEQMRLEQQVVTAHGQPLRRVVLVDLKKGIVIEHSLYDYNGVRLALAKLSGHKYDKKTGIILPHRVELDWPQNQLKMAMDFGKIQINPDRIPAQVWAMPQPSGCEIVSLDADVPRHRIATRPESTVRLGTIEDDDSGDDARRGETEFDGRGEPAGHARLDNEFNPTSGHSSDTSRRSSDDDDWSK